MKRILAAIDGSPWANGVIRQAVELARLLKSELTILSVLSSDPMRKISTSDEERKLLEFHRKLILEHFPANMVKPESSHVPGMSYRCGSEGELRIQSKVEHGETVDRICRCADEIGADMIIIGSRGLGNIGSITLGSVSEKVVRKSSRSVMVVKDAGSESSNWEKIGSSHKTGQRG